MKYRAPVSVAALAAVGGLVLAGCSSGGGGSSSSGGGSGSASSGGTLTIGAVVDANSFDPAQAHLGHYVQYYQPVYDTLIRHKPDGSPAPMLATKWSYNKGKTVLTLTLRKGITFSDGTKVDAAAVKENLDRFRKGNGPDASTLSVVSSVTAPNPTTVKIALKAPDPSLLYYLGNEDSFIASPKAIAGGHIATDPVGSGPYVYDSSASVAGSQYVYTKREGYWDPKLQHYNKIVIKPITNTTAMANALVSGQIDAGPLDTQTAPKAKSSGLTEYDYPVNWLGLFLFDRDGSKVPALKSVKVRQAINYAINKKVLLQKTNDGKGTVTSQILPTSAPGYQKDLDSAYPYNPAKAKKLLAEAGYPNGFALTMPSASGGGLFAPNMLSGIKQNLQSVGIRLTWQNVPPSNLISDLTTGKFPAALFEESQGPAWYTAQTEVTPNAVYNPLHTKDPKVESLISKVQHGSTSAAAELNKYLVAQAWFVPFYRQDLIFFTDKSTTVQPQARQAVPSIYYYMPSK